MSVLTTEQIKALAADRAKIKLTLHVLERCRQRGIEFSDIENALKNGEIIEQYPNDYPYPSCLELGLSLNNKPLHVCCGIGEDKLWIITAYYPTEIDWQGDMKTRKVVEL